MHQPPNRQSRRFAWALGVAACVSFAQLPSAHAQDNAAVAEVLFEKGRKAFEAGDYDTACGKFAESLRIEPTLGTKLNLAACEQQRGRLATAWGLFRSVEQQLQPGDARYPYASNSAKELLPRVPYVVLKLKAGAPTDIRIRLGETTVRAATIGEKLPIDPGKHQVIVSADGYQDRAIPIELAIGQTLEVPIEVGARAPTPAAPAPAAVGAKAASAKPSAPDRTMVWVLGGAGATAAVAASVFGALTLSEKSTGDTQCPSRAQCSQKGADALDRARTYRLVSNISLGVAALSLGGATYYWFTTRPKSTPDHTAARRVGVGFEVAPGDATVQLRGSF